MKIDGRAIAGEIYADLEKRVTKLKEQGITPHFSVILVGDDANSQTYVRQKQIHAEKLGIQFELLRFSSDIGKDVILSKMRELNKDTRIHGLIIQRPLPLPIDKEELDSAVNPEKDVDGFHPNSPFEVPVALAVEKVLQEVFEETQGTKETNVEKSFVSSGSFDPSDPFFVWLQTKNIVVLGKGTTAGGPIIKHLQQRGLQPMNIDSKTENRENLLKNADIVISAVGKKGVIEAPQLKQGSILIGVGMHTEEGRLRGDYDETSIEPITSFYTPTPGGVGPINVAMLLNNVVIATENLASEIP